MKYTLRLRINGVDGEVEVPFDTVDDLRTSLKGLDWGQISEAVRDDTGGLTTATQRAPFAELEGVCTIGAGGLPRFAKIPKSSIDYVGLVLYAVEPKHLTGVEIEAVTGLRRVNSNFLTATAYKGYFVKDDDGKYSLTPEGKRWITETVLLALRKA